MKISWVSGASAILLAIAGAQGASAEVLFLSEYATITADGSAWAGAAVDAGRDVFSDSRADTKAFVVGEGMSGSMGYGVVSADARTRIATPTPWGGAAIESLTATAFDQLSMASLFASASEATFGFDSTTVAATERTQSGFRRSAAGDSSAYAEAFASITGTFAYTFEVFRAAGGTVEVSYDTFATSPLPFSYRLELIDDATGTALGQTFAIEPNGDGTADWTFASPGRYTLLVIGESAVSAVAPAWGDRMMNVAFQWSDANFRMNVATGPAIPEVSTWGLMLVGFAALGCVACVRRATAA